jgi:hypothetical protein
MPDFNDTLTQENALKLAAHLSRLEEESVRPASSAKKKLLQRPYAIAPTEWWSHPGYKPVKALHDALFRAYVYLCSAPNSNCIGLYRLTLGAMAADLGISTEDCRQRLEELREWGLVDYDPEMEYVWVRDLVSDQIRHTGMKPPEDNAARGMAKLYEAIPDGPLKVAFRHKYQGTLRLSQ